MLSNLAKGRKMVGVKQTEKAIRDKNALCVFIAADADPRITASIRKLCGDAGVELVEAETMLELGRASGIEVGAAAAVLLK